MSLTFPVGAGLASLFQQDMRNESGYFNSWSRQAAKEHRFGAKLRPGFTHQKAAKELHGGAGGKGDTLRLSKALL